jgi:signal transduction histidine kinase
MKHGSKVSHVPDFTVSSEHESKVSAVAAPVSTQIAIRGASRSRPASKPLRLVLVEDSDDDAELVLRELRRGGFLPTCERVATQAAFKAALESAHWDVIVSDHALPGYGGLTALADLQATGRDIPFILVSGTIGEAVAVNAMKAGAQDYVLKGDLTRLPVAIDRELREWTVRADQAKMREQLLISERMASAGMLAAGVAHEINNPLAVAVANVDYTCGMLASLVADARASEAARTSDPAERWDGWPRFEALDESLRDASEGLQRIRDIVRDVKLFSRPHDDAACALDLRAVADSSLRMAHNEIRHRATLVKDYRDVPMVHANESRLGQVLLNLIVNAAQAIPEGHAVANEIRVLTKTGEDGCAIVEVSDTGCGIPKEDLERIFDAFYTTKPVGVGTGLGLAICYRIVTELGGSIEVASQVGQGTVFRLLLPATREAPRGERPPSVPPPSHYKGTVLIVDDDAALGRAVQRTLSACHDVVVLTSAAEALARIEAGERFDVILSDVMMPDVTGMEMHQQLLRVAPDQAARVVFLTGGAFTALAREYLDGVPNLTIEKPFAPTKLLAIVARLTEPASPQ